MKRMKDLPKLETRTVALLTGLPIGLGIAVHDIFFVVAALIALVRPMESAGHWIYEHVNHGTLEHRHFVNTPQHMRHIKVCRSFARSTSAVAVAFVTGFLVFSGESLLHARHSVSTSQPAPRLCLRAPATNTSKPWHMPTALRCAFQSRSRQRNSRRRWSNAAGRNLNWPLSPDQYENRN